MAIDSCRECLEEIQAVYALAFQNRGDLSDSSSSLPPTIQAFRLGHEQCSRADLLALEIKRRILNGELAEGDRLGSEQELVERFGVSRAVVREAGRILERLSIVETVLGKRGGMHVRKPDPESVLERTAVYFHALNVNISHVQEVALPLGLLAVEMAAREAPNLPQDQMKAELAKLVDIPSENWIATIIANLAGSPPLAFLLNIVNGQLTFEEAIEPPSLELHHAYIGQATNLMAAIAAGDVALSRRYLLHIRAILAKLGPRLRGLDDVVAQTQFPRFTHLSTISARAK